MTSDNIKDLIDRSSVGAGLRNIQENGIDAELAELAYEMRATYGVSYSATESDRMIQFACEDALKIHAIPLAEQLEAAGREINQPSDVVALALERDVLSSKLISAQCSIDAMRKQLDAFRSQSGQPHERAFQALLAGFRDEGIEPSDLAIIEMCRRAASLVGSDLEATKHRIEEWEDQFDSFREALGMPEESGATAIENEARRLRSLVAPDDDRSPPTEQRTERIRLRVDLNAAQQRIAELDTEQVKQDAFITKLQSDDLRNIAVHRERDERLLEAKAALRAIWPVYQTAVPWHESSTWSGIMAVALSRAINGARANLTPEILAALKAMGLDIA